MSLSWVAVLLLVHLRQDVTCQEGGGIEMSDSQNTPDKNTRLERQDFGLHIHLNIQRSKQKKIIVYAWLL